MTLLNILTQFEFISEIIEKNQNISSFLFLQSSYFLITTYAIVGYGDIFPVLTIPRIATTIQEFLAGILNGYVMGRLQILIEGLTLEETTKQQKVRYMIKAPR